ncbi:hypothetical protein [Herbaspirillum robiniae]|uniref:hypothetical protein n=1 Tax=Herbaspirillum robiniae TaxID=2014887 RepID=UPI003D777586
MDNRASPATQAQAALLRRSTYAQQAQSQARKPHADKAQAGKEEGGRQRQERSRSEPLLTAQQRRLPVLETDEFRVVEPDGTEDPWASADDGLVPERQAEAEPRTPRKPRGDKA